MFKCYKCIFYDAEGYRDMGVHIPECKLILNEEITKKDNKQKYDLFKALINDELQAEQCKYFTYVCEVIDIIKEKVKNEI